MGEGTLGSEKDLLEFANSAEIFRKAQQGLSNKVGDKIAGIDQNLILSNTLMLAVLMSVVDRSKNPSKIELSQSEVHRAAIIADFCKSITAFELCLSSGLYGAVATLARREIEAVNNCFAHRRGEQRNKKNPRIKPFRHLNDIYAELSGIAHNTDRDGMLLLSGGSPANLDPEFDLLRTEQLLMVHIHCVCGIALEASDIVSAEADKSGLDEREKHYCSVALGVLVKRGFLRGYDLDASL